MLQINSLRARFVILVVTLAVGFLVFGFFAVRTLEELKVNGPVYQRIVQGKDLIADILPPPEYIIESYLVVLQIYKAQEENEPEEITRLTARLGQLKKDYDNRHAFWLKEPLEPKLRLLFLEKSHASAEKFYQLAQSTFLDAVRTNDRNRTAAALVELEQVYEAHRRSIDQVVALTTKRNEADETMARNAIDTARLWLALAFLLSMGGAVCYSVVIARRLLGRLGGEPEYAVQIASRIAEGDLTVEVSTRPGDQTSLLAAIKAMQTSLRNAVSSINATANNLSSAVTEVSLVAGQVAGSSRQQSERSSELAATIEEINSTIERMADGARQVFSVVERTAHLSSQGDAAMGQAVLDIDQVSTQVAEATGMIQVLQGLAGDISGMVQNICDISDQTNLLALNAAIEAARAGESGRGFAVVADEVRKLAERSGKTSREIVDMVNGIQNSTTDAVGHMSAGNDRVSSSASLAVQAGGWLREIRSAAQQVQVAVHDFTHALNEQSTACNGAARDTEHIAAMAERNHADVHDVTVAASRLLELAKAMRQAVGHFRMVQEV